MIRRTLLAFAALLILFPLMFLAGPAPVSGQGALGPIPPYLVDFMRWSGANSGNTMCKAAQHTSAAASDTVTTGLTAVTLCVASYDTNPDTPNLAVSCSIGDQAGTPAAGSVLIKSFKFDGTSGVVAATAFSKKINYIACGTTTRPQ